MPFILETFLFSFLFSSTFDERQFVLSSLKRKIRSYKYQGKNHFIICHISINAILIILKHSPWKQAILYVLGNIKNDHYDSIFRKQFTALNENKNLPLREFIDVICDKFTRYQRYTEDGQYQIIPTKKQKRFLERIICEEECFHFSEVGSGKTKVILPLLCQTFLSSNTEAHRYFARGGKQKDTLVILVPEHLVNDARTQVFRHCLNINFKQEYRVYDDIFALLHRNVQLGDGLNNRSEMKQIFVTSFNQVPCYTKLVLYSL